VEKKKTKKTKKTIDSPLLYRPIDELSLSVRLKNHCKTLAINNISELLAQLKNPEIRNKFGGKSREEVRKLSIAAGVAIDEHFEPLMAKVM